MNKKTERYISIISAIFSSRCFGTYGYTIGKATVFQENQDELSNIFMIIGFVLGAFIGYFLSWLYFYLKNKNSDKKVSEFI